MDKDKLQSVRHSCAHLLAAAVLDLWPGSHNAIGPAIGNGFYQDFDMGEMVISEKDLPKIEKRMKKILSTWGPFETEEVSIDRARKDFSHNPYKLELIEEFGKDGKTITENNPGNFLDLCKGGHSEDPKKELKNFKLLKVAGAYWRGDEKNKMLTRIYGTAFESREELDSHLVMLEEAKKRDHRKLGKELDLFVFSDMVGPGLPLFTPNGGLLRHLLDDFVWELRKERGYERVEIPHITKKDLYETSGHWDKFKDELFRITTREDHEFAMKPMNCPHHTQIYNRRKWSYREMPQRYANTTMVYRDEQTGELNGLSRVRSITQDDAHVFCRESQAKEEAFKIWDIIEKFYGAFGFDLQFRLSTHDPENMDAYMGDIAIWEKAVAAFRSWIDERGVEYTEAKGEAAFYGPKIDFIAKDSIGREWQVATIQIDRSMPESFDLSCVNESGEDERVVMLHAAIMGSIERFMSIFIEHTAGNFPVWLSPVQVHFVPVSEKHVDGTRKIMEEFKSAGIRVSIDTADETVGKKIRNATKFKTPYIIVVGDKELDGGDLMIRVRGQEEQESVSKEDFISRIREEIGDRR